MSRDSRSRSMIGDYVIGDVEVSPTTCLFAISADCTTYAQLWPMESITFWIFDGKLTGRLGRRAEKFKSGRRDGGNRPEEKEKLLGRSYEAKLVVKLELTRGRHGPSLLKIVGNCAISFRESSSLKIVERKFVK